MVLDDCRDHALVIDDPLRRKAGVAVLIRRDRLEVVPALVARAENRLPEVKHRGEIPVVTDKFRDLLICVVENLTDGERVVGLECPIAHLGKNVAESLRILNHAGGAAHPVIAVRRVIVFFKWKCLLDVHDRIETEACDAAVQPPVHHLIDFFSELTILPVEVRLLLVEEMQIIEVRSRDLLPCASSEIGPPVIRRMAIHGLLEEEITGVFAVRVRQCLLEPLVLIGAVIDDEIHQNVHVAPFCFRNQPPHIAICPEARVNLIVIRDVIALIRER